MPLCHACQNISFGGLLERDSERIHKENFRVLKRTAKNCDSCTMIQNTLINDEPHKRQSQRDIVVQKKQSWRAVLFYTLKKQYLLYQFNSDDRRPITLGGVYKDWTTFDDIDPIERGAHLLNLQISFPSHGKGSLSGSTVSHMRKLRLYADYGELFLPILSM